MYRVALDILPIQASAVPCERVFSSSKETDTLRRANLSPKMMEVLQMLKYFLRRDLDFTDGLVAREQETTVTVPDISKDLFTELLESGRIEELSQLVSSRPH